MSQVPALTGKQLIALLRQAGFELLRKKGSHAFLRHLDGRVTVVPVHAGETIGPGLMRKILRDVEIEADELPALKKKRRWKKRIG
jgi:predicted RNA binding protein YcfA (HicA-like mRNA interferase family)